ncbi:hypothetical protein LJR231_004259 [Phyllobacterium sp. LjRoot231]|uniref:hypothetical protein n=1 Tax=Phyllobacterium sp. LjRoot231 TaxID=3342289 RepID=UPI003ECE246A
MDIAAKLTAKSDRKQRLYPDLMASSAKLQSTGWEATDDPMQQIEQVSKYQEKPAVLPVASLNSVFLLSQF